jgi:HEAT repeat protein/cyclophilin family peptidyl-prolyl cis-trans isomerase
MRVRLSRLLPLFLLAGCASPRLDYVELRLEQKLARLMKLEDERSLEGGEAVGRLSDRIPRVRRQAALALGRLGAAEAARPLAALLGDPEPAVRAMAAFALGQIGPAVPAEVLPRLRSALSDPDPEVRGRSAEALSRIGAPEAVEALSGALHQPLPAEPGPFEWSEALAVSALQLPHVDLRLGLFGLARLKAVTPARALISLESGNPRFLWWPAAWAASSLADPELLRLLLHYGGSSDPYLRLLGARGLGRIDDASARRAILNLLEDRDEKVRIEAARAAAELRLAEATPRLLQLMQADTPPVQLEALRAFSRIADRRTVDPLLDRISDPRPALRAAALAALAFQDRDGFWLVLSGLDSDPDWQVRASLADTLSRLGDPRAGALLRSTVADRDYRVRARALRALTRASLPDTAEMLKHALGAEDPFERAAAARGLGEQKPEGAVALLQTALDAAAKDTEPAARLALLEALDAFGKEALEPAARRLLEDRDGRVRRRAAELLRKWGETAVVPRGPSGGRTLYDYMDLLNPRYTPQAFIRTEKGAIEVELFVLDAPLTVENFMRLARRGFYNGLPFYRVTANSMVETGDPRGDGEGGPGYTIRSEVNLRSFLRGTLGMVAADKDAAGSRFFISLLPRPELDGSLTAFGQVTRGMEILDRIEPGDVVREIFIWDGTTTSRAGRLAIESTAGSLGANWAFRGGPLPSRAGRR